MASPSVSKFIHQVVLSKVVANFRCCFMVLIILDHVVYQIL